MLMTLFIKIMKSQPVFQIILFLRRPGETSLADIIKIAIMLTKTTLKDTMRIIKKKIIEKLY